MTDEDDGFARLKALDPYPGLLPLPSTTTSRDARFEEITMTVDPPTASGPDPYRAKPSKAWRTPPRFAAPTGAAVGAAAVVAGLVVASLNPSSAQALVADTARASSEIDSGRVSLEVRVEEPARGEDLIWDVRFDGENYEAQAIVFDPATGEPDFDNPDSVTRSVDGVRYERSGDRFVETGGSGWLFDVESLQADALVPIIEATDDFAEIGSEGDRVIYGGSIGKEELLAIERPLPPGVGFLTGGGPNAGDSLTEEIGLTVTVEGDLIQEVEVTLDGDTELGPSDVTVITTYSELGQPQNIVAPTADQLAG